MIQLHPSRNRSATASCSTRVTWQIDDRDRVGLCGPNGAGKTTLLKMLAGLDEPDGGAVVKPAGLTLGYLPQDGLTHSGRTLVDEASLAFKPLLDMKAEIARARGAARRRRACPTTSTRRCSSATASCRTTSGGSDGYSIELKVATVLRGPRLLPTTTSRSRPRRSRAAGRCASRSPSCCSAARPAAARRADQPPRPRRAQLARGVPRRLSARRHPRLARPLLPRRRRHAHRRHRRCARSPTTSATTRSTLVERDARMERLREAKRDQDEEIERDAGVHRPLPLPGDQGGAGAEPHQDAREGRAASRCRPSASASTSISRRAPRAAASVLELKHVRKAYGDDASCFDDVNLHIERGDRIALVGPNGAGKSTLMRMLSGVEAPDAGDAHRRAPGGDAVLRAGRSDAARSRR